MFAIEKSERGETDLVQMSTETGNGSHASKKLQKVQDQEVIQRQVVPGRIQSYWYEKDTVQLQIFVVKYFCGLHRNHDFCHKNFLTAPLSTGLDSLKS